MDYAKIGGMTLEEIEEYDKIVLYFSGGKDSLACVLHLKELGVDMSKVELWHHDIDGERQHFFDWPITKDYCKKVAEYLGLPIYFSWKKGGFLTEMLRNESRTQPNYTETPEGTIIWRGGTTGKFDTRRKFPQITANLSQRWCSAYLKIDVGAAAIRMQERFLGIKTLTISGERAEESTARAKYKQFEKDRSDNRGGMYVDRHVDRWRPVLYYTEEQVWTLIERHNIRLHPCYYLGFSRCSCLHCIFGNADQFATSVYPFEIYMEDWYLPAGAYQEGCGPT